MGLHAVVRVSDAHMTGPMGISHQFLPNGDWCDNPCLLEEEQVPGHFTLVLFSDAKVPVLTGEHSSGLTAGGASSPLNCCMKYHSISLLGCQQQLPGHGRLHFIAGQIGLYFWLCE